MEKVKYKLLTSGRIKTKYRYVPKSWEDLKKLISKLKGPKIKQQIYHMGWNDGYKEQFNFGSENTKIYKLRDNKYIEITEHPPLTHEIISVKWRSSPEGLFCKTCMKHLPIICKGVL